MKKLLLLFLLPTLCFAQTTGAHRIGQVIIKGNGISANVSPGSKVLVCVVNTGCATAANIYLDAAMTTLAPNPLTADGSGNYDYYVAGGCVDEQISAPGQSSIFVSHVCPFSGAGGGGGIATINGATGPAITIACETGLSCDTSSNTITISLASAFTINSFTGCGGSLELGQTVTNPTCAATYSATPSSASITNTDSIDSPLALTTPFTSGTIVGNFVHTATATTTVTLTAIGSSTQTANQTYTWKPAIFAGLGTVGATSSVTASGTTAVLSTGTVLPRAQLGAETVGETFGPFAPSAQVIYLLLTGGSHTFTDVCSGFPLPYNAPISVSFVNQYGVTVPEFLYQTTNVLTGSCFEPRIAS